MQIKTRMSITLHEELKLRLDIVFARWYGMKTKVLQEVIQLAIDLAEDDPKKFIGAVLSKRVELRYRDE